MCGERTSIYDGNLNMPNIDLRCDGPITHKFCK